MRAHPDNNTGNSGTRHDSCNFPTLMCLLKPYSIRFKLCHFGPGLCPVISGLGMRRRVDFPKLCVHRRAVGLKLSERCLVV